MSFTESLLTVADSDRTAYETSLAICREVMQAENDSEVWTREEFNRFTIADRLKDYYEEICDDAGAGLTEPACLIVSTLFAHALCEVDWQEAAYHYLAKVREFAAS